MERCTPAISATQIRLLRMNRRQLGGNKVGTLQRGELKVHAGKIGAPQNCVIKQCPRQVESSQESACEY